MAKKKNSTSTDLISYYMEYTLEHNAAPKSVTNILEILML